MRQAYDYWQNQPGNYRKPLHRRAQAGPLKGASLPSKWPPKRPKSPLCLGLEPQQRRQLIQLPPLSSPRAGPQRAISGVSVEIFPLHTVPQEEEAYASSRICTRKLGKAVPKDLVNVWQSQQSTDPKMRPPRDWQDFSSHCNSVCLARRRRTCQYKREVAEPLVVRQQRVRSRPLPRKQGEQLRDHIARRRANSGSTASNSPYSRGVWKTRRREYSLSYPISPSDEPSSTSTPAESFRNRITTRNHAGYGIVD